MQVAWTSIPLPKVSVQTAANDTPCSFGPPISRPRASLHLRVSSVACAATQAGTSTTPESTPESAVAGVGGGGGAGAASLASGGLSGGWGAGGHPPSSSARTTRLG